MKRVLLLLALLCGAAATQAQSIPNGGLDTWAGAPEKPQRWLTTDDLLMSDVPIPITTGAVTKTTDAASGGFAARLETKNANILGFPIQVPGILILGDQLREHPVTEGGGLPFTARPQALQCRYKLTGTALTTDSAFVGILLTRRVGNQTVIVGEGVRYLLQATPSYTLLQVPIQYSSALTPDSVHIIAASGDPSASQLTSGTALLLDEVTTVGTATSTREAQLSASLTAFPNPSPDGRFLLDLGAEPALTAAPLTVVDALGRTVLTQAASQPGSRRTLDLHAQPPGVYTVQLRTAQGLATRRLVIR